MKSRDERTRVSLAGFEVISVGIETKYHTGPGTGTGPEVMVMLRVAHDATGLRVGPLHVTSSSGRPGRRPSTEELRVLAKDAILKALGHEVDEWLRVDGLRAEPVHAPPAPRLPRLPRPVLIPPPRPPFPPPPPQPRPVDAPKTPRALWQRARDVAAVLLGRGIAIFEAPESPGTMD